MLKASRCLFQGEKAGGKCPWEQRADVGEPQVRRDHADERGAAKLKQVALKPLLGIDRAVAHAAHDAEEVDITVDGAEVVVAPRVGEGTALAHHVSVETEVGGNDGGPRKCLEETHHKQHVFRYGVALEAHPTVKERLSLDDARYAAPAERELAAEVEERALEERAVVVDMLKACRGVVAVDGVHAHRHHVRATAAGEIGIAQRGNAAGQQTVVGIHELDIFAPCLADAPVAGCRYAAILLIYNAYR